MSTLLRPLASRPVIALLAAFACVVSAADAQTQLRTTYRMSGPSFLRSFREVVAEPRLWTARVQRLHPRTQRWNDAALGVVVRSDGLILTKASEAEGEIRVKLPDLSGVAADAEVVATDAALDLALVRIDLADLDEVRPLATVRWTDTLPMVGRWLATPTIYSNPAAVGIVSVPPREIPRTDLPGMLGVRFAAPFEDAPTDGALVEELTPDAPADRAGIMPEDIIRAVDGRRTPSNFQVIRAISRRRPGDYVTLRITRAETNRTEDLRVRLAQPNTELLQMRGMRYDMMNGLGGRLSERRSNFPSALQHDSVLDPSDCGGAAVNLDGEAIGINIARAGRTESLLLPTAVVKPAVERMLQQL